MKRTQQVVSGTFWELSHPINVVNVQRFPFVCRVTKIYREWIPVRIPIDTYCDWWVLKYEKISLFFHTTSFFLIQARIKINYVNFLDSLDVNRPKHGANVSISQFGVRSVNDENKIARKSHQDKVTKRHVACKECTVLVLRMAHKIWKETKQQPVTAGPGNMLGCCLVCFNFLWGKLSTRTVQSLENDRP